MSQSTEGTDGAAVVDLSADERYDLLAAERRRLVVDALAERSAPVALDDLAEAVAEREADESAAQRVAVSLHHVHLPLMADLGILDYDTGANRVDRVGDLSAISTA